MKFKTVLINELIGEALDYMVAMCEVDRLKASGEHVKGWVVDGYKQSPPKYSENWLLAGEIIEREEIELSKTNDDGFWTASIPYKTFTYSCRGLDVNSPLTVAMRSYVQSKLGCEVQFPTDVQFKLPETSK